MGLNPLLPGRNIDGCFTSGSSRNSDKAAPTLATIIGWPACAAAWGSLAGARHYTTSREERHGPAPKYNGHMTRIIGADAPPLNRGVRRML